MKGGHDANEPLEVEPGRKIKIQEVQSNSTRHGRRASTSEVFRLEEPTLGLPPAHARPQEGSDRPALLQRYLRKAAGVGRVGVWRGGVRLSISVAAPFVWRYLSAQWVFHAIRSTVWLSGTGAGDTLGYIGAGAGNLTGHGTGVIAAYQRSQLVELRRPVMERWAQFLSGEEPGTVEVHSAECAPRSPRLTPFLARGAIIGCSPRARRSPLIGRERPKFPTFGSFSINPAPRDRAGFGHFQATPLSST